MSLQPYLILHLSCIFEVSQHQSVANQQLLKSGNSLYKMANGSVPGLFFLALQRKTVKGLAMQTRSYQEYIIEMRVFNFLMPYQK